VLRIRNRKSELSRSSGGTLVTGASGSLGWVVASALAGETAVVSAYHSHASYPERTEGVRLDLEETAAIEAVLDEFNPQTIFHLAAVTDPDQCERDPDTARRVNLDATRTLAEWAGAAGAKLVFASTDLVFEGTRGDYSEEDEPAPLSIYGQTKLSAEAAVLDRCPGAVVIRGSLFYGISGPHGRTFLSGLLDLLSRGERVRLFTDQRRNPVLLEDLAGAMVEATRRDLTGLYHVAGGEVLTRYEFGTMVCEIFGFSRQLLVPIKMADFEYLARRPLDSSLNIERFRRACGYEPTPIARALSGLKARIEDG
jgi:dTDP-4-dehydrorhamnose reductase